MDRRLLSTMPRNNDPISSIPTRTNSEYGQKGIVD